MKNHYNELDSLRGLAALTVIFSHYLLVFPIIESTSIDQNNANFLVRLIKFSPLHIFWAGHEAVIFFFILSGFVLSLPFYNRDKNVNYLQFLTKRICRIYIPYLIAVLIAIATYFLTYNGGINGLSAWFNSRNGQTADFILIINHLFLIGSFDNSFFDPVLWSLVQEMRISILFPVLMFFVLKLSWKSNVLLGIILSLFGFIANYVFEYLFNSHTDYFFTFHYMGMFVFGSLLARYRIKCSELLNRLSKLKKVILFAFGILLYTNLWYLNKFKIIHLNLVTDMLVAIGVIIFILISLNTTAASRFLLNKKIHFIGKISYSLYLYHCICLMAFINLLHGHMNIIVVLLISFSATFIISVLSYFIVEVPAMNLGKFLSGRIQNPIKQLYGKQFTEKVNVN